MYLNVFRNRKRADLDAEAYAADAERMLAMARGQKGFIAIRSYSADDGETLTMTEWESEADARAWRENHDHATVQARGRAEYYDWYVSYSCVDPRIRTFDRNEN